MAGLVGLAAGRQASGRDDVRAAPRAPSGALLLHGRGRGGVAPTAKPGASRVVRRFDLLDASEGAVIGEFVATALGAEASFGVLGASLSGLEMQTFRIGDDTLFAVGTGFARGEARAYALLGGTGRFAGARGTCLERVVDGRAPGPGRVEFQLTLVG